MAQRNSGEREPPQKILVVDDDPETANLVRQWFAGRPFEVLDAPDGETGLRMVDEHRPDVILLDIRMPPGIDGIAVARRLKDEAATRWIPVILLTACRDTESKVRAFGSGVDGYVTKPFECEEVDAIIRSNLERHDLYRGMESKLRNLSSENDQLEELLMIDEKTGLFNFREFQRRLTNEWIRAERYGTALSLVFLDLDHFKKVNDTLGHQVGDRVLKEFATLVAGGARATDVAARYGGEEFAVILPHTGGPMAVRVAERILAAVREFVFIADETPTRITVSAGVATFPSGPSIDSVDGLIRAADVALYRAKDAGRDRVVLDEGAAKSGASNG